MSAKRVLVIGGAASGKSAFAENIIVQSGLARTYIATARIWDAEMNQKVAEHQKMRGAGWTTVEEPLDPAKPLATLNSEQAVLLDCATMWLTNHLMDDGDLAAAEDRLMDAFRCCRAYCVVVSNEVGGGIVPADALSRRFRQAQGRLNQRLATQADTVVQVVAGLPNVLKGSL
ncbi:MAG: bifunctional adenosylcobinamide kinase/adenosylcobinamide-phosphate guanylyltransferase [Pseudomonadota bacterium]